MSLLRSYGPFQQKGLTEQRFTSDFNKLLSQTAASQQYFESPAKSEIQSQTMVNIAKLLEKRRQQLMSTSDEKQQNPQNSTKDVRFQQLLAQKNAQSGSQISLKSFLQTEGGFPQNQTTPKQILLTPENSNANHGVQSPTLHLSNIPSNKSSQLNGYIPQSGSTNAPIANFPKYAKFYEAFYSLTPSSNSAQPQIMRNAITPSQNQIELGSSGPKKQPQYFTFSLEDTQNKRTPPTMGGGDYQGNVTAGQMEHLQNKGQKLQQSSSQLQLNSSKCFMPPLTTANAPSRGFQNTMGSGCIPIQSEKNYTNNNRQCSDISLPPLIQTNGGLMQGQNNKAFSLLSQQIKGNYSQKNILANLPLNNPVPLSQSQAFPLSTPSGNQVQEAYLSLFKHQKNFSEGQQTLKERVAELLHIYKRKEALQNHPDVYLIQINQQVNQTHNMVTRDEDENLEQKKLKRSIISQSTMGLTTGTKKLQKPPLIEVKNTSQQSLREQMELIEMIHSKQSQTPQQQSDKTNSNNWKSHAQNINSVVNRDSTHRAMDDAGEKQERAGKMQDADEKETRNALQEENDLIQKAAQLTALLSDPQVISEYEKQSKGKVSNRQNLINSILGSYRSHKESGHSQSTDATNQGQVCADLLIDRQCPRISELPCESDDKRDSLSQRENNQQQSQDNKPDSGRPENLKAKILSKQLSEDLVVSEESPHTNHRRQVEKLKKTFLALVKDGNNLSEISTKDEEFAKILTDLKVILNKDEVVSSQPKIIQQNELAVEQSECIQTELTIPKEFQDKAISSQSINLFAAEYKNKIIANPPENENIEQRTTLEKTQPVTKTSSKLHELLFDKRRRSMIHKKRPPIPLRVNCSRKSLVVTESKNSSNNMLNLRGLIDNHLQATEEQKPYEIQVANNLDESVSSGEGGLFDIGKQDSQKQEGDSHSHLPYHRASKGNSAVEAPLIEQCKSPLLKNQGLAALAAQRALLKATIAQSVAKTVLLGSLPQPQYDKKVSYSSINFGQSITIKNPSQPSQYKLNILPEAIGAMFGKQIERTTQSLSSKLQQLEAQKTLMASQAEEKKDDQLNGAPSYMAKKKDAKHLFASGIIGKFKLKSSQQPSAAAQSSSPLPKIQGGQNAPSSPLISKLKSQIAKGALIQQSSAQNNQAVNNVKLKSEVKEPKSPHIIQGDDQGPKKKTRRRRYEDFMSRKNATENQNI
ncbi:hypothetical protein FGO68_gene2438 [Halteria grandinella]|uniref:Uncharacterized protein n=1 Tax=Halteria grandinella TaxID=5974 RepID=A0A8J8T9C9_HALGN|nr:hypothetical protein FGO68_gene2438 [Halteria grandinella]